MNPAEALRISLTMVGLLLVGLTGSCVNGNEAEQGTAAGPSVQGSYELMARDLPDGSTLEPPDVFGFMTFTEEHRHFHIHFPGTNGEPVSVSSVGTYDFDGDAYTETRRYEVSNNQPEGSGLSYDLSREVLNSAVTMTDGDIQFRDGENGPVLVFTETGLTATQEGVFVDRWTRVE